MKNRRRGFTLIEVLVVIGILLLLMSILLPVLARARRQAQMNIIRMDFQTISAALENYKQDFKGGYPCNVSLPGWNTQYSVNGAGAPSTPPSFLGLAVGLLGPGPIYTQNGQFGDGNTGFGFRATSNVISAQLVSPASSGDLAITVNNIGTLAIATTLTNTFISITDVSGTNYNTDDEIGVTQITISGAGYSLSLARALASSHNQGLNVAIKTPSGRIWGPYLATDKFKFVWINGQPQLLDRFGGPIQYFTRFGLSTNRTAKSVDYGGLQSCTAGPLYGVSASNVVDSSKGEYAIWDQNDGTLNTTAPVDESIAFKWMLGDDNGDNLINGSERLRYDGPYILISAGPDSGSSATNPTTGLPVTSKFCNLSGIPQQQWDQTFRDSGNVYNFTR